MMLKHVSEVMNFATNCVKAAMMFEELRPPPIHGVTSISTFMWKDKADITLWFDTEEDFNNATDRITIWLNLNTTSEALSGSIQSHTWETPTVNIRLNCKVSHD